MFEQSCSGKSSFSQALGPAMPEKWPPLLPTLQQCPYKNPYTGSAIMRAKGPQLYSPKSRRRSCHATLCDSAWDGSPQGKELAARRRVDRQHEILFRSYRDQRWWVQRTRSSAISSDHLVPYQDDEQRIWRCCSSTCARPGRTRILRVWRFPRFRRSAGNLQSLRLIITVWRVKPRRRERIGTHRDRI